MGERLPASQRNSWRLTHVNRIEFDNVRRGSCRPLRCVTVGPYTFNVNPELEPGFRTLVRLGAYLVDEEDESRPQRCLYLQWWADEPVPAEAAWFVVGTRVSVHPDPERPLLAVVLGHPV